MLVFSFVLLHLLLENWEVNMVKGLQSPKEKNESRETRQQMWFDAPGVCILGVLSLGRSAFNFFVCLLTCSCLQTIQHAFPLKNNSPAQLVGRKIISQIIVLVIRRVFWCRFIKKRQLNIKIISKLGRRKHKLTHLGCSWAPSTRRYEWQSINWP